MLKFGIICLTSENLQNTWIHYEAGAASRGLGQTRIAPILLDVERTDVKFPLARFNSVLAERNGISDLVSSINRSLGETSLDPSRLEASFEKWWPDFEKAISDAKAKIAKPGTPAPVRNQDDMTREILAMLRGLAKDVDALKAQSSKTYSAS